MSSRWRVGRCSTRATWTPPSAGPAPSIGPGGVDNAVLVQPADGKIVTAGYSPDASGYNQFALARYNPDGSVDPGFGSGGRVITSVAGNGSLIHGAVLQADGKIVAVGEAFIPPKTASPAHEGRDCGRPLHRERRPRHHLRRDEEQERYRLERGRGLPLLRLGQGRRQRRGVRDGQRLDGDRGRRLDQQRDRPPRDRPGAVSTPTAASIRPSAGPVLW